MLRGGKKFTEDLILLGILRSALQTFPKNIASTIVLNSHESADWLGNDCNWRL